ncbi:hypothetical protein V4842_26665 [Pseudomonas moraviensis]
MSRKVLAVCGLVAFSMLTGCGADKPSAFVGHWVEISSTDSKPMTLDISKEGNVFHIDEKKSLFGKEFESKLEGKADSDSTLSAKGGAVSFRLQDGRLFYKGRELSKSS